ncbi:MAG: STAS domain-containing protein [Tepidisphaeraceae bacterium]
MSDVLEIEMDVRPDGTVLRLIGNAGVDMAKTLETTLTRVLAARPTLVVADMSKLVLLSSLAMGQLVTLQKSLGRSGGKMRLAAVPPQLMTSLKHTRLDSVFECLPSVKEAMKA